MPPQQHAAARKAANAPVPLRVPVEINPLMGSIARDYAAMPLSISAPVISLMSTP